MAPRTSTVPTLELLLLGFAVDAQFGDRTSEQALHADGFAAALALSVLAVLDALERLVDFLEESPFAFAHPSGKCEIDFGRCRIDFVGEVIGIEMDVPGQRALGIAEQFLPLQR